MRQPHFRIGQVVLMAPTVDCGRFRILLAVLTFCIAAPAQSKSPPDCSFASAPAAIRNQYQSGIAALQENRFPIARRQFESLVKGAPRCAELHDLLGYAMWRQGELKPAIQEFEAAVRLKPGFQLALIHLAE